MNETSKEGGTLVFPFNVRKIKKLLFIKNGINLTNVIMSARQFEK